MMGAENYHVMEPVGEDSSGEVYERRRKLDQGAIFETFADKHLLGEQAGSVLKGFLRMISPFRKNKFKQLRTVEQVSRMMFNQIFQTPKQSILLLMSSSPGFANPDCNKQSGCQILDRLENNSRMVKGAQIISQDDEALAHILLRIKQCLQGSQNSSRDQDILVSNQSLRILSNLVAAGAITSSGLLDEIIHEILVYSTFTVSIKSSKLNELRAKNAPGLP